LLTTVPRKRAGIRAKCIASTALPSFRAAREQAGKQKDWNASDFTMYLKADCPALEKRGTQSGDGGPTWSRDGKWIYFSSNRTGKDQVWKIPAGEAHSVLASLAAFCDYGWKAADAHFRQAMAAEPVPPT